MEANTKGRTTARGLVPLYVVGGVVAAALGTTPLAVWLDTVGSNQDIAPLRDIAAGIADFGARTGLDQPYKQLHQALRNAEAAKFFGSR